MLLHTSLRAAMLHHTTMHPASLRATIPLLLIIIAMLASACAKQPRPVPRREGYPRIAAIEQSMGPVHGLPVAFSVNQAAIATIENAPADQSAWLTISYPAYHAKVYCTFSPVSLASAQHVVNNRLDRILTNIADAQPEIEEFDTPGGANATVITAPSATSTPVQFIAVMPGWVVSGSAFLERATAATPADSIAPVVEALRNDIVQSLLSLAPLS